MGNCCDGNENPHGPRGRDGKGNGGGNGGGAGGHGNGAPGSSYHANGDVDEDIDTTLNTEEASEIARLSRAESVSKLTNEPSQLMITLRRKFIITRAAIQHGINEDVDQFYSEIQESISDMREKDRRRVREWLESVHRALRGRKPTDFPPLPKKVLDAQRAAAAAAATAAATGAAAAAASADADGENRKGTPRYDNASDGGSGHDRMRPSAVARTNSNDSLDMMWTSPHPSIGAESSSGSGLNHQRSNSARSSGASDSVRAVRNGPALMEPNGGTGNSAWGSAMHVPGGAMSDASSGSPSAPSPMSPSAFDTSELASPHLRRADGSVMAVADGDDTSPPRMPLDRRRSLLTHELVSQKNQAENTPEHNRLAVPKQAMDMRSH